MSGWMKRESKLIRLNRSSASVENKTTWQTRDLKRIIVRVARKLRDERRPAYYVISYSPAGHRGSFAEFNYETGKNASGSAFRRKVANHIAKIYVPRKGDVNNVQLAIAVYETIEFGSYKGPSDDFRRRVELAQEFAWADTLPMRRKPPKAKPTADERRAERRTETVAAIKRWTTKQKRATTALRKLRTKLRRIDRKTQG